MKAGLIASTGESAAVRIAEPASELLRLFDREVAAFAPPGREPVASVLARSLISPLRVFLGRSGKGLRARLVEHGWALAGGDDGPAPDELRLLPELLHSASLIIDDIEDGATQRRGGPALHRVIGTARAINAANWLYFWPYRLVDRLPIEPSRREALLRLLTSTLLDAHRGQALDLGVPVWSLRQGQVVRIVAEQTRLKTGRLTAMCIAVGALAAGASPPVVRALDEAGEAIGVALQMLDDVTSVLLPERRHKAMEDLRGARPTWAWSCAARNLDRVAYQRLRRLARVGAPGQDWESVRRALAEAGARDGQAEARRRLGAVAQELLSFLGDGPAIDALAADLDRLGRAYG